MDRLFTRTIFEAHIPRQEYRLFRDGLPPDYRLPNTFEEWEQHILRTHEAHRSAGLKTQPITISWDELLTHAKRVHLPLTYALLTGYAIHLGNKKILNAAN
jgi:hypothetical protein